MSLDDVVSLSITVQSKAPSRAGFGTPLVLGYHTIHTDRRVLEYASAKEMTDDGFSASSYLVKVMNAIKSQNPCPKTVKFGRRATSLTQIIHLIPTVTTEGAKYTWTIGANTGSYTVGAAADVQDIVEAIQPTLDAYAEVVVTEDDTKLVVTAAVAGAPVAFTVSSNFKVIEVTADTTTDDELAAVVAEDDDWYGLLIADSASEATTLLGAAFTETVRKIFVAQTADWDTLLSGETTDVMSQVKASAYARTSVLYHSKIAGVEWAAAAWMAGRLTSTPGSDTWAFKTLAGITVDVLSQSQQTSINTKRGSYYVSIGGISCTFEGKTGSGEYMDTIRFVDWLYARIRERIIFVLANNPKIPYTDSGVGVITAAIEAVLLQGISAGGLSDNPAPVVTAPKVADVDPIDKIGRLLPDVEFTATLAGAIHRVEITGTIAV